MAAEPSFLSATCLNIKECVDTFESCEYSIFFKKKKSLGVA